MSFTQRSTPSKSERATMAKPMFSSSIPPIAATGAVFSKSSPCPALTLSPSERGVARRLRQPCELSLLDGAAGVGVGPGVQLDEGSSQGGGRVELPWVRVDEDRHDPAGLGEARDGVPQAGASPG